MRPITVVSPTNFIMDLGGWDPIKSQVERVSQGTQQTALWRVSSECKDWGEADQPNKLQNS